MEAERKAEKEAMKKINRTEVASRSESRVGAAEEPPTRRTRQAVLQRPRASAFQGEPSQKKERKRYEAAVSA